MTSGGNKNKLHCMESGKGSRGGACIDNKLILDQHIQDNVRKVNQVLGIIKITLTKEYY